MAFVGGLDCGVELVGAGEAVVEVVVAQARVQPAALGERGIEVGRGAAGDDV